MEHRFMRPLESLLSKSQKALAKLKPGTWQAKMLLHTVEALRLVIDHCQSGAAASSPELRKALQTLEALTVKTMKTKFAQGTSQHSLQQNRLAALRAAMAMIQSQLAQSRA